MENVEEYVRIFGTHNEFINVVCYVADNAICKWNLSNEEKLALVTSVGEAFNFFYVNECLYHNAQFIDWDEEERMITIGVQSEDADYYLGNMCYKMYIDLRVNSSGNVVARCRNFDKDGVIQEEPVMTSRWKKDIYDVCLQAADNLRFLTKVETKEVDMAQYNKVPEECDDDDYDEKLSFNEYYEENVGGIIDDLEAYYDGDEEAVKENLKIFRNTLQSIYDRVIYDNLDCAFFDEETEGFTFMFRHEFEIENPDLETGFMIVVEQIPTKDKKKKFVVQNCSEFELDSMNNKDECTVNSMKLVEDIVLEFSGMMTVYFDNKYGHSDDD